MRAGEIPASAGSRDRSLDPAAEVVRAEIRELVGLEVSRLPRKYREAVALCHLDGLSHDGAAEALGLPVGTIRSRSVTRKRLASGSAAPPRAGPGRTRQPGSARAKPRRRFPGRYSN